MTADPDRILSEFMDAWNAGRRPSVQEYLERVPDEQQAELAEQITAFLTVAPTPRYDDQAWEAIQAEPLVQRAAASIDEPAGLWPAVLARLRERSHLSLPQLAAALNERLGVRGKEDKTAGYLEQMERGALEPSGVSRRVIEALARALGVRSGDLESAGDLGWSPRPSPAFFRADAPAADDMGRHLEVLADAMAAPSEEEWDEVDELFRGGR